MNKQNSVAFHLNMSTMSSTGRGFLANSTGMCDANNVIQFENSITETLFLRISCAHYISHMGHNQSDI